MSGEARAGYRRVVSAWALDLMRLERSGLCVPSGRGRGLMPAGPDAAPRSRGRLGLGEAVVPGWMRGREAA